MAKDYVRVSLFIDKDVYERFQRLHPTHGAFSRIVRTMLRKHLESLGQSVDALLEPEDGP